MAEIVRFQSADGLAMLVEVDVRAVDEDDDVGLVADRRGGVAVAATRLEDSLQSIEGAAVALMGTVQAVRSHEGGLPLDEVALEVSLSLGVAGGVVVAKGSANAHAAVTLTWRRRPNDGSGPEGHS
jgi:hypothetical protein